MSGTSLPWSSIFIRPEYISEVRSRSVSLEARSGLIKRGEDTLAIESEIIAHGSYPGNEVTSNPNIIEGLSIRIGISSEELEAYAIHLAESEIDTSAEWAGENDPEMLTDQDKWENR
jgi:hypothetical protein